MAPFGHSMLVPCRSLARLVASLALVSLSAQVAAGAERGAPGEGARPGIHYEQFRVKVELQVASKRHEQIATLERIIQLGAPDGERGALLFRLAELYWEESKYFAFEANQEGGDGSEAKRQSERWQAQAIEKYRELVTHHPAFERMDEVLFFLAHTLWEGAREGDAAVVLRQLIARFPQSKYVPDAWVAIGQAAFDRAKGERGALQEALMAFARAAAFTESRVKGYALYMQAWCHYNLGAYRMAMSLFEEVVRQGEGAGSTALSREATKDFVLAFSRVGDAAQAGAEFARALGGSRRAAMLEALGELYFQTGKDREAIQIYDQLTQLTHLNGASPGVAKRALLQGRAVECTARLGNKRQTALRAKALEEVLLAARAEAAAEQERMRAAPAGEGGERSEEAKALAEAEALAEQSLSTLAVAWHGEAKKTKDGATHALAAELYDHYLRLFPTSPRAYELRFFYAELLGDDLAQYERAANEYGAVVQMDEEALSASPPKAPGRYLADAAYAAVLAWDALAGKEAPVRGGRARVGAPEPAPLTPQERGLVEACARYLRLLPEGAQRVELTFKAANVWYRANHFEEAVSLFGAVALEHPEHALAEVAANLLLDSFNLAADWPGMNRWARRLKGEPRLAKGKLALELDKMIEQSAFKSIAAVEERGAQGALLEAAEGYIAFSEEFPRSELADLALFNASIDLFKGRRVDRSMEVRKRLVERYPRSRYLPACAFANGESFEALGDFGASAQAYEAYALAFSAIRKQGGEAKDYPQLDEKRAQLALFNAAVFRAALGQHREAIRDRLLYLVLWPDSSDAEQVELSIVALYEEAGQTERALAQLREYQRRYNGELSQVLMGRGRAAQLYERRRELFAARAAHASVLAAYERAGKRERQKLTPAAREAVARALLAALEPDLSAFAKKRFPSDPARAATALKEQERALLELQKRLREVVALDAGELSLCALGSVGTLYRGLSRALREAPRPSMPLPAQLKPIEQLLKTPWNRWPRKQREAMDEAAYGALQQQLAEARAEFERAYAAQLEQAIAPVEQKAREAFDEVARRAREAGLYTACHAEGDASGTDAAAGGESERLLALRIAPLPLAVEPQPTSGIVTERRAASSAKPSAKSPEVREVRDARGAKDAVDPVDAEMAPPALPQPTPVAPGAKPVLWREEGAPLGVRGEGAERRKRAPRGEARPVPASASQGERVRMMPALEIESDAPAPLDEEDGARAPKRAPSKLPKGTREDPDLLD